MTRFLDSLAGTLAGLLIGVLLAAAIAPHAWEIIPTPRAALESIPAIPRSVGSVALDDPAQLGQPDQAVIPAPVDRLKGPGRITPVLAVTGSGPEPTRVPAAASPLRGYATWYDTAGGAAAGPDLRAALGPGWRGMSVVVTRADMGAGVVVQLTDWCACGSRNGVPTLIDLDRESFAVLALPSAGIVAVTVAPIPAPPVTSTR